jgi:uncharacterized protein YabN with tetrapyrrole methylase and pyrophosphatase domain
MLAQHKTNGHGEAKAMRVPGSLTCIGVGTIMAAHLTPAPRGYIQASDLVFASHLDAASTLTLQALHSNVRSFSSERGSNIGSQLSDDEIVEMVLEEVRSGKRVCVAFFGHPSTAAKRAQMLIRSAHQEGFFAHVEPAISIEDCIYAHLGIDPAMYGCQQYDVRQFMLYRRSIDTSAYLILWRFGSDEMQSWSQRQLLMKVLARDYPLEHKLFAYTPPAANAPLEIKKWAVGSLMEVEAGPMTALVIPPAADLLPDLEIRSHLARLSDPK